MMMNSLCSWPTRWVGYL